jgi:ubiquinone/menaquinone biosynthesis C-methylase UbiE
MPPVAMGTDLYDQELVREIALKKKLVNFWNSHRVYWDGISTEEAAASPQRERAAFFLPDGAKVLDVACGSVANASLITRRCSYVGSDISETGLRRANTAACG